jgi:hypothetical protein
VRKAKPKAASFFIFILLAPLFYAKIIPNPLPDFLIFSLICVLERGRLSEKWRRSRI